jgi:cobalt-precorrin-5B (C1)-methyltransferase
VSANTVLDAYGMVGEPLAQVVAEHALARLREAAGAGVACDVVIVDREGAVIARAG